ncbi:hypothetical protein CH333_00100 [candidate division WOR-3 bacterium JGI_Cruoil_03_44_89]|uniref:Uncharacterized protein n=1 Tax=candidate division WOR-3 bacterium JGI_Cruoil_03_44_89 TaxID=1973748 RepID=A0A235C193_UNCW3|nr:MAG: hypothetical protein CH333_00100 [candidate division WOR-3 bacterium JGI_Cruoil_03_44_89]
MKRLTYTYALVKSLYDQGKDYIDSFWPFAIKAFPSRDRFVDSAVIQKASKEKFGLEIPLGNLVSVLSKPLLYKEL